MATYKFTIVLTIDNKHIKWLEKKVKSFCHHSRGKFKLMFFNSEMVNNFPE